MSESVREDYLGNVKSKSLPELMEILQRQERLLANRKFIRSLPDNGQKIRALRDRLQQEIDFRKDVEKTAGLLRGLSVMHAPTPGNATWTVPDLDSDDDLPELEDDGVAMAEAVVTSVMEEDETIPTSSAGEREPQTYAQHLYRKVDNNQETKKVTKLNELPKSTSASVKQIARGESSPARLEAIIREFATKPEPLPERQVQPLSLQESMHLYEAQTRRLEEVERKHAAERLRASLALGGYVSSDASYSSFARYREPVNSITEDDEPDPLETAE